MAHHIIVSVGKWGVKTRPWKTWSSPQPGDIVDFGEDKAYPYTNGRYGRIWSLSGLGTGKIHVCCELGSAFLYENGGVSISGGPFTLIEPGQLKRTFELKRTKFWNWGDNWPGARQGVDYWIDRPVWLLKEG